MSTAPLVYIAAIGFCAGVLGTAHFSISLYVSLCGVLIFLALSFFRVFPFPILLFVLCVCAGAGRFAFTEAHLRSLILPRYIDEKVEIVGVVVSEPEQKSKTLSFIVSPKEINGAGVSSGKVLVSAAPFSEIEYGDMVSVKGKLALPKNFSNESGIEFDYVSYLKKDGVIYTVSYPQMSVVEKGRGNPVIAFLLSVKNSFVSRINAILPSPQSGLLSGMLIAGKGGLPKSVQDQFKIAGVVHIVVLSGFNITVVAITLSKLFGFLSRKKRIAASFVGVIAFVLMTGADASIVRAGIMASIALLADLNWKTYSPERGLVIAGLVMVMWNPMILPFDPSFQLSFIATCGIIYFSPIVERFVTKRIKGFARELVVSSTATQLFVLPLLIYMTGSLSLVSLPVNFLVLPVVSPVMLVGFVSVLISFIHPYLAFPFTALSHALLSYVLKTVSIATAVPYASVSVRMPVLLCGVLYVFFGWLIWKQKAASPKEAASEA